VALQLEKRGYRVLRRDEADLHVAAVFRDVDVEWWRRRESNPRP